MPPTNLSQGSEHLLCVWWRIPEKFGATRTKDAVLALRGNHPTRVFVPRDDINCFAIARFRFF